MIELVDYKGGNIGSITRCLQRLDAVFTVVDADNPPSGERPLLFPGVGAFGAAMENLQKQNLIDRLRNIIKAGTPYLGICIGLQVLFEASEEANHISGLGVLDGKIVKFSSEKQDAKNTVKIPQIGWNWVQSHQPGWESGYVYFVNSYYPEPSDASIALYRADYGGSFTAAVQHKNITAFQFHPEKSGEFGQNLIRRWLNDVR